MSRTDNTRARIAGAVALLALGALGAAAGWWWGAHHAAESQATSGHEHPGAAAPEREVLYWYDPMMPEQHFDKPGKSPFMDMELVPKYAEDSGGGSGVSVDAALQQSLGMRLATVARGPLSGSIDATGVVAFNERALSVLQARAAGFVERAWPLAAGDIVRAGEPLAVLRIPEWTAAQRELLALSRRPDARLKQTLRERLLALGMPAALVRAVETDGKARPTWTLSAPRSGVLLEFTVREGMTVAPGQTLARINGLDTAWIEVAVPEASGATVATGNIAQVRLTGAPQTALEGRVASILPALDAASRSLRLRIELPNPEGRLRAGMSASVNIASGPRGEALTVPTEAVIRTGKRSLVMRADGSGRFSPVAVELGPEIGDRTVITAGLVEGEQVVASGQFLIDSEASLTGMEPAAPGVAQ